MYSGLLRGSTAKGSSTGFSQICPAKVEALKSYLFTESFLILKIKNTFLIFCVTLYFNVTCLPLFTPISLTTTKW